MRDSVINPDRPDSYRWLAWIYDQLARLVFGGAILRSQHALLASHASVLASSRRIVWIGGGTGRALNNLLVLAPHAQVIYIEPSARMMTQALRDVSQQHRHRVQWIHQDHLWLWGPQAETEAYEIDVLITAFFLDVLTEPDCRALARRMGLRAKWWLFADFVPQRRRWAKLFIKFMYLCFTLMTRIKQRDMLDLISILRAEGWHTAALPQDESSFALGLIRIERLRADHTDEVQMASQTSVRARGS